MQGSCNVTGMGRILEPLRKNFENSIKRFDVTLVRRWADIEQKDEIVKNISTIVLNKSIIRNGFLNYEDYINKINSCDNDKDLISILKYLNNKKFIKLKVISNSAKIDYRKLNLLYKYVKY